MNCKTPALRISGSAYEPLGVDFLPNLDFHENERAAGESAQENVLTDHKIRSLRCVLENIDQDDHKDEGP